MTVNEFDNLVVGDTVEQDLSRFGRKPARYIVIGIKKVKSPLDGKTVRQVVMESEDGKDTVYLWNKLSLYRYRVIPMRTLLEEVYGPKAVTL